MLMESLMIMNGIDLYADVPRQSCVKYTVRD
jgi:hypothetical protein